MKAGAATILERIRLPGITILLISYCAIGWAQQNAQFTQYMFNGLVINPAYTGMDEALNLTFVNRSQWLGVDGAPVTQTLTAHTLFSKSKLGIGMLLVNDKIGVHKNQKVAGSAAYHLTVSRKGTLSFGMQGGLNILKSNYGSLNSTIDPQLANVSISQAYFNLGLGFYYRSPKFHAGVSLPDLIAQRFVLNDTASITWQKAQYFIFSKYIITLNDFLQLEPSILVKYKPELPLSFDLNACLIIKQALTLGLSYRKSESIDFLLKAQLTPQLQLGYSYDFVTGEVSNLSRGSHELMVSYLFKYSHDNIASPR
ncbi:MAG: type IX secretion system membrane protein PorP/SprF [Chryseolinea sp.]